MKKILTILLVLLVSFSIQAQNTKEPFEFVVGETYQLFGDKVKLRKEASSKSDVIDLLPIGSNVTILEKTTITHPYNGIDWSFYKIESNAGIGYTIGGLISYDNRIKEGVRYFINSKKEEDKDIVYTIRVDDGLNLYDNNEESELQDVSIVLNTFIDRSNYHLDNLLKNSGNTTLAYYEKVDGKIILYTKQLPFGESNKIAEFDTMPLDVLWDLEKSIIYFITQKGIIEYNDKTKQKKIISEQLPNFERFDRGWIDDQGVINISYAVKLGMVTGSVEEDMKVFHELTNNKYTRHLCVEDGELWCCIAKIGSDNRFIITETIGSVFGELNYGPTGPNDCVEDGFNVLWDGNSYGFEDHFLQDKIRTKKNTISMINLSLEAESQNINNSEILGDKEANFFRKKVHGKNYSDYMEAALIYNLDFGKTIVTEEDGDGYGALSRMNYFYDLNNNRVSKIEMGYNIIYTKPYVLSIHNPIYVDYNVRHEFSVNKTTIYDIRNLRKIYENKNAIMAIIFND